MLPPPPPRPPPFRPRSDLDAPLTAPQLQSSSTSSTWLSGQDPLRTVSSSSSSSSSTSSSSTATTSANPIWWRSSATATFTPTPQVQCQPSTSSSGDRDIPCFDPLPYRLFNPQPPSPPPFSDPFLSSLSSSYLSSSSSAQNLFHPQESSQSTGFRCRCTPPSSQHISNADCISRQLLGDPEFGNSHRPHWNVTPSSSSSSAGNRTSSPSSSAPPLLPNHASAPSVAAAAVVAPSISTTQPPPPPPPAPAASSGISCPVCFDDQAEIKGDNRHLIATNCGHVFCNTCITDAIKTQKKCPTCRKKLGPKGFHKLFL